MKRFAIRQLAPAAALLFALGATLASAQDAPHRHDKMGGHGKMGFGMMRGLARLDLTEAQKTQVKGIMESRKAAFESLRERMRAEHRATMEQIRSILTPEQQEKFDTMKQHRRERFGERRERREG